MYGCLCAIDIYILKGVETVVYRRSLTAVVWNFVSVVFVFIFVFVVLGFLFGTKVALVGAVALSILYLGNMIRNMKMKVVVQGNDLDIYLANKEYHYEIDKINIRSESRDFDSFTLKITDENGVQETFDLSLLGYRKYNQLLYDLGFE